MIGNLLQDICTRITEYLDGDLEAAATLPDQLMDLVSELELEQDSEWFNQILGKKVTIEHEKRWRKIVYNMLSEETMPVHVCAEKKFLGGKQFQRAKELLMAAMSGRRALLISLQQHLFSKLLLS